MRRLYLRIYLAVLASLIVFALIAGAVWRLGAEMYGPRHDHAAALAGELVAELLPQGLTDAAAVAQILDRWHRRAGVDLSLFGAGGELLASAGRPMAPPGPGQEGFLSARGGPPAFIAQLPDGRQLVLRRSPPANGHWPRRLPWPGFLMVLALIALAVGVGAYPIVRRLTGRLERLQRSVDALGAGNLSARVKVEGTDEVASLAASFNHSAQRIEALMKAQKDLLANASHELRSPLARIRMALELLPSAQAEPVRDELARDVRELDQLIDEILLASRLDSGAAADTTLPAEPVDLAALCAEECARARVEFTLEGPTDASTAAIVSGDGRLLRRMIRNLIENALRYGQGEPVVVRLEVVEVVAGGSKGAARVDLKGEGAPQCVIEVCDRGPGVPPDERQRIFEPFYRARGASERTGGVGLGLSLVRQIAEHHRGAAACLPRDGGGSCFRVTLPAAAPATSAASQETGAGVR